MAYLGDFGIGKTFDTKFCTVDTTGAPTTLAGSPVVSAYVDNSLTQITAGITLTVDFDGVTGLNNVRVVATVANGYASGSNYHLVITTGTVGGTSVVGYPVGEFSLEARGELSGIRKNVAYSNFEFLMVSDADYVTPKTGLTVAGQRSIDGGAFENVGGAIAEVGNGIYQFDALAADTNGDTITWKFSSVGAQATYFTFRTVP